VWSCGCDGHGTCSVMVTIVMACDVVVIVLVIVPHVVSHSCHTTYGVMVMIVVLYGDMRAW
jgi:hypothetical protein